MTRQEQLKIPKIKQICDYLANHFQIRKSGSSEELHKNWNMDVPIDSLNLDVVNAYREKLFDYDLHISYFDDFFTKKNIHSVCSLGCGLSPHILRLAKKGYKCTGVDLSKESLEKSQALAKIGNVKIEFINCDLRLFHPDDRFDALISMYVPLSIKGFNERMEIAQRILKKDGFLVTGGLEFLNGKLKDGEVIHLLETIENYKFQSARIEEWWLVDNVYRMNVYYFVKRKEEKQSRLITFVDINDMVVHPDAKFNNDAKKSFFDKYNFKLIDKILIPNSQSSLPKTDHYIEFYQLIK